MGCDFQPVPRRERAQLRQREPGTRGARVRDLRACDPRRARRRSSDGRARRSDARAALIAAGYTATSPSSKRTRSPLATPFAASVARCESPPGCSHAAWHAPGSQRGREEPRRRRSRAAPARRELRVGRRRSRHERRGRCRLAGWRLGSARGGRSATSGKTRRHWLRGRVLQRHLVDPRTGRPDVVLGRGVRRGLLVSRGRHAARAAFLLSRDGPAWLDDRGLPGRFSWTTPCSRTMHGAWRWQRSLSQHERHLVRRRASGMVALALLTTTIAWGS